jgi:hypothetical protein
LVLAIVAGCERGSGQEKAAPDGDSLPAAEIDELKQSGACAVFGAVLAATTDTSLESLDADLTVTGMASANAKVTLLPSRVYGQKDCSSLLVDVDRLEVLLRLRKSSPRPELGERAAIFVQQVGKEVALDAMAGISYRPAVFQAERWFLGEVSKSEPEQLIEMDEALQPMERVDVSLPESAWPCGLNREIIKKRLELVEEGAPIPFWSR